MKNTLLTISLILTLVANAQIPTNGLSLYQTFDNHLKDVSSNNYATYGVNTTFTTDRVGRTNSACHFNGNTFLVDTNTNWSNVKSMTFSFWFKTSSMNQMYLMTHDNLLVTINNGKVSLKIGDSVFTSTNTYNDNVYHNVIINRVDFVSTIYYFLKIDSSSTNKGNKVSVPMNLGGTYLFGSSSVNTYKFTGDIDDILIYNRDVGTNANPPDSIFHYKPPVFNNFLYQKDSIPNFTITGKYFLTDGGVSKIIFPGGSFNPITIVNDSVIKTNVPFSVQVGYIQMLKGFDVTYSPTPFDINSNVGINNIDFKNKINVFPNPANENLNIDNASGYQVNILNMLGQEIFTSHIDHQHFIINLSSSNCKGLYLVQILNPQGNVVDVKKIILE